MLRINPLTFSSTIWKRYIFKVRFVGENMREKKRSSNIFVLLTLLCALGTLFLIILTTWSVISLISGIWFYLNSPNATILDWNGIGFIFVIAIVLLLLSISGFFLTLFLKKKIN